MANEGRETSEGCYWSDDLLLGWMEVVENWNLEILCSSKMPPFDTFCGFMQIKSIIKLVNEYIAAIYKKHQNPLYLTTHENNIAEIAFLHRVRSISYPPRKVMRCSWPCGWSTTSMKTCKNSWYGTWRSNEILFSQNWLMLIYIYSSGFTEFPVLIVRHHQMNLWFYSLTRLKMRSCLRCECKSARWRKGDIKLFHDMFLFNFMI